MQPQLSHFAINADDVDRAKQFYTDVFGWTFTSWGQPGFFKIAGTGVDGAVQGALQGRRALAPGLRLNGFECTIAVASIETTAQAVTSAGGKVLMPPMAIPSVGTLAFFQDPEGTVFGAMQYER